MTEPRKELLHHAADLITGDRNKTYGSPTQNFEDTAAVWTVQLRNKLKPGVSIDKADVALLMIALKLVREIADHKADNWVDIAGYAGCGFECAVDGGQVEGPESWGKTKVVSDDVVNYGDPEPPRGTTWRDTGGDVWSYEEFGWAFTGGGYSKAGRFNWLELDEDYFPMVRVS